MIVSIVLHLFIGLTFAQFDYTENGEPKEYSDYMNDATAIYQEIFNKRNYNKFLAPIYGKMTDDLMASNVSRLNVNMILRYLKVFNLDAESQILSLCWELELSWRDPRLAWNPKKFNNTGILFVTTDSIWTPDNQIGNAKSMDSVHPDSLRTIMLLSNGTVTLPMVYYSEVACPVNITKFPFDNQTCAIPIAALALDIKYSTMTGSVDNFNILQPGNGEWEVTNVDMVPYQIVSGSTLTLLSPIVCLKRVPNYYVYVIALPCFILTLLAIVGMFWSPLIKKEQLTRLSIGLTSLVSMTVLMDMLSGAIPKTSVFPLLGIYVVLCVGITSLACVTVVFQCIPNPKKKTQEEILREKKEDELRTKTQRFLHRLKEQLLQRHVFAQFFFQSLNLLCFIVFLSFWH
ncbi:unnamed protein product, partial [Mesorhabditis belari]|uniref:Uncharacterized protein n=1 Tax=Mesorhabditis belari TaxID=2138241 RepID=A0AAF3EV70_9BILA